MVAGPLHGATKCASDAGTQWKWLSHNFRDYVGQRAHLEFTPTGQEVPLAVAEVVQANSEISETSHVNPLVAARLTASTTPTLESLARDYERLFHETLADLAADRLAHRADAAPRAALVNWILENLAESAVGPGGKSVTKSATTGGQIEHLLSDYRASAGLIGRFQAVG